MAGFFLCGTLPLTLIIITIILMLERVHHVRCEDVKKAIGYIGEQVILKLDINPAWQLEVIEWTIYENYTFIATLNENELQIFNNRLELNTTSGDLTIKNVTAGDALKYRAYLRNTEGTEVTISVELSVQEPVNKPKITLLHSSLYAEKCLISLKCSSLRSHISLSWHLEPGLTDHFCSDSPSVTGESVMWTSLKTNRDAIFTCVATDGIHNESRTWNGKCQDAVKKDCNCHKICDKDECPDTGRGTGKLIGGLFAGVLVGIIGLTVFQTYFLKKTGEDGRSEPEAMEENKQELQPSVPE